MAIQIHFVFGSQSAMVAGEDFGVGGVRVECSLVLQKIIFMAERLSANLERNQSIKERNFNEVQDEPGINKRIQLRDPLDISRLRSLKVSSCCKSCTRVPTDDPP